MFLEYEFHAIINFAWEAGQSEQFFAIYKYRIEKPMKENMQGVGYDNTYLTEPNFGWLISSIKPDKSHFSTQVGYTLGFLSLSLGRQDYTLVV